MKIQLESYNVGLRAPLVLLLLYATHRPVFGLFEIFGGKIKLTMFTRIDFKSLSERNLTGVRNVPINNFIIDHCVFDNLDYY